ncbi:MAG: caspase family protein [Bacteroidota bacterium]
MSKHLTAAKGGTNNQRYLNRKKFRKKTREKIIQNIAEAYKIKQETIRSLNTSKQTRMSEELQRGAGRTKKEKARIEGKNYLFAIGIDKYQHPQFFPTLRNPVKDATAVIDVLVNDYQFEKQPGQVMTLFNEEATQANILDKLEHFSHVITENDNLVIYFAGHGEYKENIEEGFWIPYDGEPSQSRSFNYGSFLSFDFMSRYFRAINSLHTVVIADSCYSGAMFRDTRSKNYVPKDYYFPSRFLLTAGRNEVVSDGGKNSPFAEALLTYLKRSSDPQFNMVSISNHVKAAVMNNTQQTPSFGVIHGAGDQQGSFYFRKKNFEPSEEDIPSTQPTTDTPTRSGQQSDTRDTQEEVSKEDVADTLDTLKGQLKALIQQRDFDGFFTKLQKYVDVDSRLFNDFIGLQGQITSIERDQSRGVVDSNFVNMTRNRIANGILYFIDRLDENDVTLDAPATDGMSDNDPKEAQFDEQFYEDVKGLEKASLERQLKMNTKKLGFLQEQEITTIDPNQKFNLKVSIEETEGKINALKKALGVD